MQDSVKTTDDRARASLVTPYLQVISGPEYGKQYALEPGTVVLGRHPNCDVVLDASAVSRYHAHLLVREDGVFVEDLKSRNGTFVNDQPITGQHRLSDTDQIRVCDLLFAFRDGARPTDELETPPPPVTLVDDETHTRSSIMGKLDLSADGGRVHISASSDVKLQALLELTNSLGEALSVSEVLPPVLESLFKIFLQADRGFIMLTDAEGNLQVQDAKFRRPQDDTVRISRTIMRMVMEQKQAIISADAAEDSRFGLTESIAQFQIRSFMCAPLINRDGDVLGTVQLDTLDPMREFKEQDLEILAAVTSQAAVGIQSARLHEAALEQRALQRDLELAQQVQMALLPQQRPEITDYQFFDYYRAANKIGGDYFDYVTLPDGRLAVIVADVTGHGIASALLMSKLAAEVRFCLATIDQPSEVMNQLNQRLCADGVDDRFVTMVLMILRPDTHELTIVNAGHQPPLCRSSSATFEDLAPDSAGLPLGVTDALPYDQESVTVKPGDSILLWTDGITEAMNEVGEQFGNERLQSQVAESASSVEAATERIIDSVRSFAGNQPQSDDICFVGLSRSAEV